MQINLPIHSYELRSRAASPARLVNCFPEALPAGAKTPMSLARAPGVEAWKTFGSGPIRGMHNADLNGVKKTWIVSGNGLWGVDEDDATTAATGESLPNTGDVAMAHNQDALVLTVDGLGFYYDGVLRKITDDDFVSRGGASVVTLDNFFIFREPNSNRFFAADYGSPSSFDSLFFGVADANPDLLVDLIVENRQLVCFCENSIEIWENTGGAGFPFERNINGVLEVGCVQGTAARAYDMVFWLADDYTVRRLDGNVANRVSTYAIEQKLAAGTVRGAFSYDQEGHSFYILTLDEGTYCYDVSTGAWHERVTYGKDNWNIGYAANIGQQVRVGDRTSEKVGLLSFDTYTEQGSTQRMEWTYQPVYAMQQRAFHDRLEIVLETGVGATTGQGSDPKIMLDYSDDGGRSWTNLPDRQIGLRGESLTRCVWHNLGSARQRVYRAAVSDPVPVTVTDTVLQVKGGRL